MLNRQSCFSITLRLSVLYIFVFLLSNFVNNMESFWSIMGIYNSGE